MKSLVRQIKEYLTKIYGAGIKKVILYGSYVRGEATKDSDIDLLELVSVIVVPEHLYEDYNSPFMLNVRKEELVA